MGRKYKIAVIEGDGVGPEIVREAIRLLNEVGFNAEFIKINAGLKYYEKTGKTIEDGALDIIRRTHALIKGPIAWLGSPNTALLSVILTAIWKGFPFSTLMYLAAIQAIPDALLEAAEIDGANIFSKIRHVIIPYISPVIKLTVMLTSVWTFNYFDLVWVMTHGGPINSSHIFPTYVYQVAFEWFDFGMGSVYGIIDAGLLLAFSLIYIKVLGKGWID